MVEEKSALYRNAILLVERLERLSADSIWAHKASGLRISLLCRINQMESDFDFHEMIALVEKGFKILEKAAEEIPYDGEM